jgi:hypothetical protein
MKKESEKHERRESKREKQKEEKSERRMLVGGISNSGPSVTKNPSKPYSKKSK